MAVWRRRGVLAGAVAALVLAGALGGAFALRADRATATASQAGPEGVSASEPPRVVEALPLLKARLDANPNAFMGAVLVARGDQILFRQVYGMADIQNAVPLRVGSRFRLASISKQFTAAAILKLQDEGRLKTGDKVCAWIQPCPEAWADLTIAHLISHTSGIPDVMQRPGWGLRRVTPTNLTELTEDSKLYPLRSIPGEKLAYNNAGFNLAADIVERASGVPYADYLKATFFLPLGMTDTGLGDTPDDGKPIVVGYANLREGLIPQNRPNVSVVEGAGALYSTLDDVLKWQRALHGGKLLSAAAYAEMTANHAPPVRPDETRNPDRHWGYGLFIMPLGTEVEPAFTDRQIYHTGSWSGFRNLATYQPDSDVTVIVLSNSYYQREEVLLITQQALAEVLGRQIPERLKPREPAGAVPAGAR
ncbi:serine hydrolase domain-containing protein [Brevundimonas sp. VNH65]|uniref:serine hydrolase domain-containing protein n=1 Tax=Brevundimonas sp. VNH65 TaxID=3400917 RepID=UPI003BFD364B